MLLEFLQEVAPPATIEQLQKRVLLPRFTEFKYGSQRIQHCNCHLGVRTYQVQSQGAHYLIHYKDTY